MQFRLKKSKQKTADTETWHLSLTNNISANGVSFESVIRFCRGSS
jgi:hypothetical protein